MQKLLLILICLFLSFEVRSDGVKDHQWEFWYQNREKHRYPAFFYIDRKNIETRNGFIYWYILENAHKHTEELGFSKEYLKKYVPHYVKLGSTIFYKKGDCQDMKMMELQHFHYKKRFGKLFDYSSTPENNEWFFPIETSVRRFNNSLNELRVHCKIASLPKHKR